VECTRWELSDLVSLWFTKYPIRQSYDYCTITPKLRSTYDLLIYETSCERCVHKAWRVKCRVTWPGRRLPTTPSSSRCAMTSRRMTSSRSRRPWRSCKTETPQYSQSIRSRDTDARDHLTDGSTCLGQFSSVYVLRTSHCKPTITGNESESTYLIGNFLIGGSRAESLINWKTCDIRDIQITLVITSAAGSILNIFSKFHKTVPVFRVISPTVKQTNDAQTGASRYVQKWRWIQVITCMYIRGVHIVVAVFICPAWVVVVEMGHSIYVYRLTRSRSATVSWPTSRYLYTSSAPTDTPISKLFAHKTTRQHGDSTKNAARDWLMAPCRAWVNRSPKYNIGRYIYDW